MEYEVRSIPTELTPSTKSKTKSNMKTNECIRVHIVTFV